MSPDSTTLKPCSKCKRELPATSEYFAPRPGSKDGLRGQCRECMHLRRLTYYAEHRDAALAYTRQWNRENKERVRENKRHWEQANREKINQRNRELRQENPDRYRSYSRKWAAANPDKVRAIQKRWLTKNRDKARSSVRRSYWKHREKRLEKDRRYREKNPEKRREAWQNWYAVNAENVREKARERSKTPEGKDVRRKYLAANAERIRERNRNFYQTPEGKARQAAYAHNRRARKSSAGGTFTSADIEAIRKAQNNRCYLCGKKLKNYHVDHFIPLALGGTNDAGNLRLACPKCNMSKSAKHPFELGILL